MNAEVFRRRVLQSFSFTQKRARTASCVANNSGVTKRAARGGDSGKGRQAGKSEGRQANRQTDKQTDSKKLY